MEAENKALKEKLDREAGELKKKMADADDEKAEEMKILQNRLDSERRLLNEKMEREKVLKHFIRSQFFLDINHCCIGWAGTEKSKMTNLL